MSGALFEDPAAGRHLLSPHLKSLSASSSRFRAKDQPTQHHINDALDILNAFGIPMAQTGRRRECMAMAFMAVAGVPPGASWADAQDFEQDRALKSRDIIDFAILTWARTGLLEVTTMCGDVISVLS